MNAGEHAASNINSHSAQTCHGVAANRYSNSVRKTLKDCFVHVSLHTLERHYSAKVNGEVML